MATYLATVQIGRYEVVDSRAGPVRVVGRRRLGRGLRRVVRPQPAMMEFFVERFGPYPFASYTVVITDDDLEIPLESQSLSTFGRNFASADWDAVRLVAHELAHQWFGNAVTLRAGGTSGCTRASPATPSGCGRRSPAGDSAAERAAHHHAGWPDWTRTCCSPTRPGADVRRPRLQARRADAARAAPPSATRPSSTPAGLGRRTQGGSVTTELFIAHCAAVAGER